MLSEDAKRVIEVLSQFFVCQFIRIFIFIFFVFHIRKQADELRIAFPQLADCRNHIHNRAAQVAAVVVFEARTAVHIHCGIKLLNQSAIIHDQAVVLALIQSVRAGDCLQQTVLFQLLVDVKHLTDRRIKAGQQLAAYDQNVNLAVDKLVLDRFLVGVGVTILFQKASTLSSVSERTSSSPSRISGAEITTAQVRSPNFSNTSR